MTTQTHILIQDQNLQIHSKGAVAGGKTNGFKGQQKGGLGVRKALANITNSEKPSSHQRAVKKNHLKEKPVSAGVPTAIAEERCLHNHQGCMDSQTGMDMNYFRKTLGLDDDFSIELASPYILSRPEKERKVYFSSTPNLLEFEATPELLNQYRPSIRSSTPWSSNPLYFEFESTPKLPKN